MRQREKVGLEDKMVASGCLCEGGMLEAASGAGLALSRCELGRSSRFLYGTRRTLSLKMWAVDRLQHLTPHPSYITSVSAQFQPNDSAALTPSFITAPPTGSISHFLCGEAVSDYHMTHVLESKTEAVNYFGSVFLLLLRFHFTDALYVSLLAQWMVLGGYLSSPRARRPKNRAYHSKKSKTETRHASLKPEL